MQFWKSVRYRVSLIRRGEIEVATVELLLFFVLRAALLTAVVGFLYINLDAPFISAWRNVTQALSAMAQGLPTKWTGTDVVRNFSEMLPVLAGLGTAYAFPLPNEKHWADVNPDRISKQILPGYGSASHVLSGAIQ